MGPLWSYCIHTTRMDVWKRIKGKEKIGRKITEMIEENVPGLQDMNFQNKRIHCGPRIAEEERPTPGYTIMELQTTKNAGTVLKLPVKAKRKTEPAEQGDAERVWTSTPQKHLQTLGSIRTPSKLWEKSTSSLGLDSTSKLSNKFVGKIKSFRYFLGRKDVTKTCDVMEPVIPWRSPGGVTPWSQPRRRVKVRFWMRLTGSSKGRRKKTAGSNRKNGRDASEHTEGVADKNVIHTLEHPEKKLTPASEKPGTGEATEGRAEQEHRAQRRRTRGRGTDTGVLPGQGWGGNTNPWAPTQPSLSPDSWRSDLLWLPGTSGDSSQACWGNADQDTGSVNSELICFSKSVNSATLPLTANVSYFH